MIPSSRRWFSLFVCLVFLPPLALARDTDFERDPINYSSADAHNAVERLQQRLDEGQTKLTYDKDCGYLRSLLRELKVPVTSQMLVFSKTSLQRQRINPRKPRAIYFGDDAYIGYCQKGDLIEITAQDPQLGPVFYSLNQKDDKKAFFKRETDRCLICHASSSNRGYPGHLVRSLFADPLGLPHIGMGTYRTDHSSPLKHRWGGWYVTGTSGKQTHLGNLIVRGHPRQDDIDNTENCNVVDLDGYVRTSPYPSRHSDIVAFMVLEHQTEMHNRIARANYLTRLALHDAVEFNKALGRPADYRSESTLSRIKNAGEPVVKYMLMCGETRLTDTVKGTSGFAEEFCEHGLRDDKGRSLRQLDLKQRLFVYPCSYLIYSEAFDALPGAVKDYVFQRLWEVLQGKDTTKDFAHLSSADRGAIVAILRATKKNLPDYWR